MSTILLFIKPEYVSRILEGSKRFEFRRSVAKRKEERILIYSTAPVKKVVTLVEVTDMRQEFPCRNRQRRHADEEIKRAKS